MRNPAEKDRSNPEAILASIVRQLSCPGPDVPLFPPTLEKFKEKQAVGFASGGLELKESTALALELTEYYPVTFVVIDALDECDEVSRLEILDQLQNLVNLSPSLVKVLVSSRDEQDIAIQLEDYYNVEISSVRNTGDIEQYVKSETERLVMKGRLLRNSRAKDEMRNLITEEVIKGSAGM